MKRNYYFLLLAMVCLVVRSHAQVQPCYTDEMRWQLIQAHPEILKYEAELERQIQNVLKHINYNAAARTTTTDETGNRDFWYDIPVVVHIIHDFGSEYVSDDAIFKDLENWNIVYAKQNPDTALVIPTFVPWIGDPHIRLHLATIDPDGNPTKGITRRRSYLTYTGGEQAKFDDWAPSSYVNIWAVNTMSSGNTEAAAYALEPPEAAGDPFGDGIICLYNYLSNAYDGAPLAVSKTINHEMGHVFNLMHTWGNDNSPGVACGDDGVDDTPPTMGHLQVGCVPAALYDTACAVNYFKIYSDISGGDSLVDYPDTVNAQNIMDYTYCARMFTKGQVARMHATLNSTVAGRNNLWDPANLINTGALAPRPDLLPIPDFSATSGAPGLATYKSSVCYFSFPGNFISFNNESYNDTLQSLEWTFSNGASVPEITYNTPATLSTPVKNKFTDPGWVSMTMTATGNNSGSTTRTWPRAVYIADAVGTQAPGYLQEFTGADTAKWPMFNYYNNEFKWQCANVGMYDHSSVEYLGYDSRINTVDGTFPMTGSPSGDFDDLFSIPVDLSAFSGNCYLNYYYSGASRSGRPLDVNDTMDIDYSVNKGAWVNLVKLTKGDLDNKGASSVPYVPVSVSDWAPMGISIPATAKSDYTVFRFRYRPNVSAGGDGTTRTGVYSSGNNFYMDRISFSQWPASVANVSAGHTDVVVVPNPTSGDAYVVVKDADNTDAQVVVTDITGKTVFSVTEHLTGSEAHIQIPHAAISVQGIYIVQTITGKQVATGKLVVD